MKNFILFTCIFCITLHASSSKIQVYLRPEEQKKAAALRLKPIQFMPGLYVGQMPLTGTLGSAVRKKMSIIPRSYEELEVSTASMLLKTPDNASQLIKNWWDAGFTGKSAVIGILDSGVPDNYTSQSGTSFTRQSGLADKNMIVNRGKDSGFDKYLNGVRTAHGTGVACVYANTEHDRPGIAYGAKNLLVTLSGDSEVDDTDWELTLHSLDWLLTTPNQVRPNIINYSFGNGDIYCSNPGDCSNNSDWSSVAQVIDYIVNHYQITWIKSAGNAGWIDALKTAPFASTLSVPADSYNAIVVANMNNTLQKTQDYLLKTSDRNLHTIQYTSSRGPTLNGRRKPDITAPGNDTRTCAPSENIYAIRQNPTFKSYSPSMQYNSATETRLVGGTSIAAPHVGAAAALIYDSGIKSPMAIKALLINSADTWTDNAQPGPNDAAHACNSTLAHCGHGKKMGSFWNRTYGWGYINMDTAFKQRNFVKTQTIKPGKWMCYMAELDTGDKITVAWERRVDPNKDHTPWALTPLSLSLYDLQGHLLGKDDSRIDNVLQVSNYPYPKQYVLVKVAIPGDIKSLDGAKEETFAIASSNQLNPIQCSKRKPH